MQHIDLSKFTGSIKFHDGTINWYLNGRLHREDGPARELSYGTKEWWLNGKLHREDGPAREHIDGSKEWYLNGILSCIELRNKDKEWYNKKGKLHREDGPAVEWANGTKEWYSDGKLLFSNQNLPKFIILEEFTDENNKRKAKVLLEQGIEIWPNFPELKQFADDKKV
jgi:hypothetical protein